MSTVHLVPVTSAKIAKNDKRNNRRNDRPIGRRKTEHKKNTTLKTNQINEQQ